MAFSQRGFYADMIICNTKNTLRRIDRSAIFPFPYLYKVTSTSVHNNDFAFQNTLPLMWWFMPRSSCLSWAPSVRKSLVLSLSHTASAWDIQSNTQCSATVTCTQWYVAIWWISWQCHVHLANHFSCFIRVRHDLRVLLLRFDRAGASGKTHIGKSISISRKSVYLMPIHAIFVSYNSLPSQLIPSLTLPKLFSI